jgi:hypothetical protein
LVEPQVSFEFKGVRYSRFLSPEAGGSPVGGSTFEDERGFPSFASIAYPVRSTTLGLFFHELVNYRSTMFSNGSDDLFLYPFTSVLDVGVQNFGVTAATELGSDLSLGLAAGLSRLSMGVDFPRYGISQFEQRFVLNRLEVDEQSSNYFVNAGLIWRPNTRVNLGAVYKRRASFSGLEYTLSDALKAPMRQVEGTLKVPDAFGGGISVRITELFTVSVDAVTNLYSQLASEQVIAYEGEDVDADDYRADDGTDLHLGAEYVLLWGQTPISFRGGIARVAPSNIYYVGLNEVERALWGTRPCSSTRTLSFGAGVVLIDRFQLEGAGVFGEDRDEFAVSVVYLFR